MPRVVRLGTRDVSFSGPEVGALEDASPLLLDPKRLRERFEADGYVWLRGVVPAAVVERARECASKWSSETDSVDELRRRARSAGPVRELLEHRSLFDVAEALLAEPATTFSFKWMRRVAPGTGTGAHCDAVYMGRGSRRVRTVWIPFDDTPVERGTLAVCEGSHRSESFRAIRECYGALDVDRDRIHDSGWFTSEPLEVGAGRWRTNDFAAGDILVFDLLTMHAATTNTTKTPRLSCDVRFQPASEPADGRWVGREPVGHTAFGVETESSTSVSALRKKWGV